MRFFVLVILVSFFYSASSYAQRTTLERIQSFQDSVVGVSAQTITLNGSTGSLVEQTGAGVIVDPSGLIVTNTHIIYGSNLVRVILKDGFAAHARIIFISSQYDFAFLRIDPPAPLKAIEWADVGSLQLGQEVITIGHSPLLDQTISSGIIRGIGTQTMDNGKTLPAYIEISINHYPGDSGGPVFDTKGRFAGLMEAKRTSVQRSTFAISADTIRLTLGHF